MANKDTGTGHKTGKSDKTARAGKHSPQARSPGGGKPSGGSLGGKKGGKTRQVADRNFLSKKRDG